MRILLITIFLVISLLNAVAENAAPRLMNCPPEILKILRGDLRRAFLNVTFTAKNEKEERAKLDKLMEKTFGGPFLTFDRNDKDKEYQVCVVDGEGDKKTSYSFLYNQTLWGWQLEARLEGVWPVGSSKKYEGWRDITTRETKMPGVDLMRTFRRTKKGWVKISEDVMSGG